MILIRALQRIEGEWLDYSVSPTELVMVDVDEGDEVEVGDNYGASLIAMGFAEDAS